MNSFITIVFLLIILCTAIISFIFKPDNLSLIFRNLTYYKISIIKILFNVIIINCFKII